jgi:hypothetical protein
MTSALRCQLVGSDRCVCGDLSVRHNAPVLAMCRKLIAAGYDPDCPLEAYRSETLCLRISSIGHGAQYTAEEHRGPPELRRYKAFSRADVAPPIRPNDGPATYAAEAV